MKKYQLTLSKESIAIETNAQKAGSYASYALLSNGLYICNSGNLESVETKYFDTLAEVREYIAINKPLAVTIDREATTADSDSAYAYTLKEYYEDNEQYEDSDAIENEENAISCYILQ